MDKTSDLKNKWKFDSKCERNFKEKKRFEKFCHNGRRIDIDDIRVIVTQCKCSWNKAFIVLKREGNIVDTVLSLIL